MDFDAIEADFAMHEPKPIEVFQFFKAKKPRIEETLCAHCSGRCFFDESVTALVCSVCASMVYAVIEQPKPTTDVPTDICYLPYRRLNHFKEILTQMQAHQSTTLPSSLLTDIKARTQGELDLVQLRSILKSLGMSRYYEHAGFILEKLGVEVPRFDSSLVEQLISMFHQIQQPYSNHAPPNRTNFLNYHFILYKLLEMRNETRFLLQIPMLTTRNKLAQCDTLWRLICQDLGWPFIPTV